MIFFSKFFNRDKRSTYDIFRVSDYFYNKFHILDRPFEMINSMGLIYAAHGYSLSCLNYPLINDKIVFWNSYFDIPSFTNWGQGLISDPRYTDDFEFDNEVSKLLECVYEDYGKYRCIELMDTLCEKIHNSPFITFEGIKYQGLEIPNEYIKKYFDTILGLNI